MREIAGYNCSFLSTTICDNVYFSFGYVRCPVVEYDAFLKSTFFLSSDTGKVMIYRARNYKKSSGGSYGPFLRVSGTGNIYSER